jgi:hypothetical protein
MPEPDHPRLIEAAFPLKQAPLDSNELVSGKNWCPFGFPAQNELTVTRQ